MRGVLFLVCFTAGMGGAIAQNPKENAHLSALEYWENQPPSLGRDTTLIRLYAQSADLISNLDSSLFWLQKGFKVALQLRSNSWLAFTHNRIGLVYLRKGVSFTAIEYLFKGLQYAELAKNPREQAFSWSCIGDCYSNLKKYDKAILAENYAIALYRKNQDRLGLASSLNDLGAGLSASHQLDASIEALELSLSLSQDLQNAPLQITTYHNLASTLLEKKDYAKAEKYGLLAMEKEIETRGRANAELLSLLSLIKARNTEPDPALNYAARAEFYLSYEWPLVKEKTAYNLFAAYKSLHKPDTALQWHETYIGLREQNRAQAQEKRIEVLRYEYDAQQRDARMQLMADDMARESYLRNALIAGILVFLVLATALFRSNRLLQKRRRELDETNAQLTHVGQLLAQTNATLEERVEERTDALREANRSLLRKNHEIQEALFRGQTLERKRVASELHNNLGSLLTGVKWRLESLDFDSLSRPEQTLYQSVVKLITDAYNQVRHISHNLLPSILEKEGLIPALEKLIADVSRTGKLRFDLVVPREVVIDDQKVAFELYSCTLELINNILKHADARQVVLEIVQTEGFHILMITDDGIGLKRKQSGESGQGLENIRQRVGSLNGNFSVRSLKNGRGTAVTLRIPRQPSLVS